MNGLWALFGAAAMAYISPFAAQDIKNSFSYETPILDHLSGWLYDILPLAAAYAITILAAYLIRVRHRNEKSLPEGPSGPSTSICGGG